MERDRTGRDGITPHIPSFSARKSRSCKLILNVRERLAEWDRIGSTASPRRQQELGRKFCHNPGDDNKNY